MRVSLMALCLVAVSAQAELLNPNLASQDELAMVSGLDDATVANIIAARPFLTASALDETLAKSLDAAQRETVYQSLFRKLNLNTASGSDIKLIPGMSDRMVHEFEEYRPYTSMEQFRREIGKYVDDAEVARLAQYVFVPVSLNAASEAEIMTIPGMTARMAHEFEEYRPVYIHGTVPPGNRQIRGCRRSGAPGKLRYLGLR